MFEHFTHPHGWNWDEGEKTPLTSLTHYPITCTCWNKMNEITIEANGENELEIIESLDSILKDHNLV